MRVLKRGGEAAGERMLLVRGGRGSMRRRGRRRWCDEERGEVSSREGVAGERRERQHEEKGKVVGGREGAAGEGRERQYEEREAA